MRSHRSVTGSFPRNGFHTNTPTNRRVSSCSATSQVGYQNLCQLITRFKMREATKAEGAATFEDLEEFSAGLICLTGGEEGPLAATFSRDGDVGALKAIDRLTSIYGRSNVYVELQRHRRTGRRMPEFRSFSTSHRAWVFRSSRPTVCAMPSRLIVNSSTFLQPFATTPRFIMPGGY